MASTRRNRTAAGLGFAGAFALASLMTSCAQPPAADSSDTTAVSNRPQQYDRFIAILRLNELPLLATATRDAAGRITLDEARKQALLEEQARVERELSQRHGDQVQVLSRYRFTLNGLAIVAPIALKEEFAALSAVSYVEGSQTFARAVVQTQEAGLLPLDMQAENSASFIGASRVRDQLTVASPSGERIAVSGHGVRIGVIDTGIDYTHKMFGGAGTRNAYLGNDPKRVEAGSFPTAKVRGGIDLAGPTYDPSSPHFADHVPQVDADPLDIQGHGTHVAGTIAGVGDNEYTYDGVAPDAELFAIKVFGDVAYGSTSDHVVINAFEYAVDPDGDLDPADRLHVLNLSLGSNFGTKHVLYEEALSNLVVHGDVILVAAAGNSGDNAYIVGAPSTAPEAISVAASVDAFSGGESLADTLASFSSRGPRSIDGLFKPEIAAPGYQIVSAAVGRGDAATKSSGTSMAAPHVAGMMALLRQLHPTRTVAQLKSLAVNSAKPMSDVSGRPYPLARQGAGRVQIFESATTPLTIEPSTLSLGLSRSLTPDARRSTVVITNHGTATERLKLTYASSAGLSASGPVELALTAGQSRSVTVAFEIDSARAPQGSDTLEAVVTLARVEGGSVVARLPALAVVQRPSLLAVESVVGGAGSARLTLANKAGAALGNAEAFVALGRDALGLGATAAPANPFREDVCDLESAGYRIVRKRISNVDRDVLQVAVNLHKPISTWHLCEVSVQIDGDGDGKPEQELLGTFVGSLSSNIADGEGRFHSLLMDWDKMVERRRGYEQSYNPNRRPSLDYLTPALLGSRAFFGQLHGSLAIVEAELSRVSRASDGSFHVKVGVLGLAGTGPANDDFLGEGQGFWVKLAPDAGRLGEDASVSLASQQSRSVTLNADADADALSVYFPLNAGTAAAPRVSHQGD